ncbi:hypothetical protein HIM_05232 [Hirsutella minnesotensis 3608]|uniref:FAS1 domain-containing protein n=1 Tax=Hirsutella minnesotensis 3608 TaxID=1043627 RepID=A0A0F7ZKJ5_9HYPO|nr:hypothetical protein HIM_05232 [Hirsutella minnesotensis 3608]
MRAALTIVVGAAAATAFVVPDVSQWQVPLAASSPATSSLDAEDASWLSSLPSDLSSMLSSASEDLLDAVDSGVGAVQGTYSKLSSELARALSGDDDHPRGTIYQLIRACGHTSKFADAVDKYPHIVDILNATDADRTLFVPTNEAFKHIHDLHHDGHEHEPSKDFIEAALRYHIADGNFPAGRILHRSTLPTTLHEKWLGEEPQRLRTSIGLHGVEVNFYSKVVAANLKATNGVIHAVSHILVPPPTVGRVLTLFPQYFSTLLLAYEKTDFVNYIHHVQMTGSTVWAPSNYAWKRLGVRTNAFLFNTEKGRKYLRALLKYQISPNATFYSDAFYDKTGEEKKKGVERHHWDLPTLLGKARVSVDSVEFAGFSAIRVNGFAHITVRDGISKNGVIQVLDSVLIPPCKKSHAAKGGEIEVDDLKARLEPYLEHEETSEL